jgi:hypothetical protein
MTLRDRATPSLCSTNFSGYRVYQDLGLLPVSRRPEAQDLFNVGRDAAIPFLTIRCGRALLYSWNSHRS